MADRSMTSPKGIIEYVLIKIDKFIFPVNFVVLDMEEDEKVPLILGRPFLATSQALIDVESGELTLRVGDDKVCVSIYKNDKLPKKGKEVCMKVKAMPLQGVRNMQKVPKQTPLKKLSASSSGEEQWGRKLNSSIHAKVDQNEMVPIVKKVDVMYLSIEEIEKSIIVKKKKKITRHFSFRRISFLHVLATMNKNKSFIQRVEQNIILFQKTIFEIQLRRAIDIKLSASWEATQVL